MLIYEYKIRDEFERVKSYATRLRQAFEADRPSDDLLADAQNLAVLFENLRSMLPEGLRDVSNFSRHIGWMQGNLRRNAAKSSRSDIDYICSYDIPTLEKAFIHWCASADHYDRELAEKIGDLIARQEFDSAVRKAFVLLKAWLVVKFSLPDNLDGVNLVNRIFGNNGHSSLVLDPNERQAVRDLLAGLYGVFRNKCAHSDKPLPWYEADAALTMINFALKELENITR